MEILKDVAEVMNIFSKATVLVEGHTATQQDKMDVWAFELANSRASFIKSRLESLGIDPHRVASVGLLAYLGCGKPAIKFKILSYGDQPDEPWVFDKSAVAAENIQSSHNVEIEKIEAEHRRQINEERSASQKEVEQLNSRIERLTKEIEDHALYRETLEEHTKKNEALQQEVEALQTALAEEHKAKESMHTSFDTDPEHDIEQSKIEALEAEVESLRSQLRSRAATCELHAPRRSHRQTMVLDEIRKRNRVLVDLVHHQLHLNSEMGFKAVLRSETPYTEFEDEQVSMEILKDVAEVMNIFSKATVLVEGHTATPQDKMDDWAFERANNRSSFIKSRLESLGIDPHRVTTVGLPGYLGCGKPAIKFKILSYGEQSDEPSIVDKAAVAAENLKSSHNVQTEKIETQNHPQILEESAASRKKVDQLKSEIQKLTKEIEHNEACRAEHTKKTEELQQQVLALQTEARTCALALGQSKELHGASTRNLQERCEASKHEVLNKHAALAMEHAAPATNHEMEVEELGKQLEILKSESSAATEISATERSLRTAVTEAASQLTASTEELQQTDKGAKLEEIELCMEADERQNHASEAPAKASERTRQSRDDQATAASNVFHLRQEVENLQHQLADTEGILKRCIQEKYILLYRVSKLSFD